MFLSRSVPHRLPRISVQNSCSRRCIASTLASSSTSSRQRRNSFPTPSPGRRLSTPTGPPAASHPPDDEPAEFDDFGSYSVILPPEPFVFGTTHITQRPVPYHIPRPPYADAEGGSPPATGLFRLGDSRIALGGEAERCLRKAGSLAKQTLEYAVSLAQVGVTTDAIDAAVHRFIIERGAYPSPLRYNGYPKACCTSVNNIVVHGIPDDRPLEDGDIVNIDITVFLDGYHGDTSKMILVGDVDAPGRALVSTTTDALEAGIAVCGPGQLFRAIGNVIHTLTAERGYSVSSDFTGHGIGDVFHRAPWILHHRNDEPGRMQPGHCFTIEPAIIQGANPRSWIFPDGWTASTENCARSAQQEHMVLITESGVDVLTR
ncbi:methionine aminopeptidase [Auriscalpium vulgare]|uniref:Methionine aminopeptidase n=1 Tax=Auriscalpium vulgare TaxID=40419 RepID=A0ACB8SD41_9AGAM|nr:methionine aminopeptidase [Auriscalpium vulgare]